MHKPFPARLRQSRPVAHCLCAALLVACLLPQSLFARGLEDISLRGFGTFGLSHSSQDDADFSGNFFQPNGAGHTRSWAASVDSKLGLQLDATVNDRLSAVLQVVSQYRYDGSYDPKVEWAYLSYQLTPDFTIRLGRIVAPTFMESETRLVGYTYPWARPPAELYDVNPITNKDGIDLRYRLPVGDILNTFQFTVGTTTKKFPGGEADVAHTVDIQHVLEYGTSAVRIAYMTMDMDVNLPAFQALAAGLTQFADNAPEAAAERARRHASRARNEDIRYAIFSLGFNHNPGNWLLRGEWAKTNIGGRRTISDVTAWYVTVGQRLGRFTPYATIAEITPDKVPSPDLPTAGLNAEQAQVAAALDAGFASAINAFAFAQESLSLGLRWEARENIATKLQFQHLRSESGSGSPGRLTNAQADFRPGSRANVFSLTVDFVF